MSLELSSTVPLIVAKSGIPGENCINLYGSGAGITIPMDDFCSLVEYALCNTDLFPDDPRIKLVEKIEHYKIAEGYNPNGTRIKI